MVDDKINDEEQMYLLCWLFQWPCGRNQCSMSRATSEASGRPHWVTTCSILPWWPPGQQAKKQQSTNTPKKAAILMARAVHRYNTTDIVRRRRSRASLEATGCCYWASIAANRCNWSSHAIFFKFFHRKLVEKGRRLTIKPLFSIGVWHIKQMRSA